ncbi:hypothetical protein [Prevotella multiformis]|nr:hypothetical protein [Prevotella multiformis]
MIGGHKLPSSPITAYYRLSRLSPLITAYHRLSSLIIFHHLPSPS